MAADAELSRLDQQIARLLLEGGFITQDDLKEAIRLVKEQGTSLRQALVSKGLIGEQTYSTFLSVQLRVPLVDLRQVQVDEQAVRLIPEDVAYRYKALPLGIDGNTLRVAMDNPQDAEAVSTLNTITGYEVRPRLPIQGTVTDLLGRYYKSTPQIVQQLESILGPTSPVPSAAPEPRREEMARSQGTAVSEPSAGETEIGRAPVVRAVDMFINQAIQERASDIHIEPLPESVRIRYRIDGVLQQAAMLPKGVQAALTSRIKVMSGMDIAEHRRAQDGHFSLKSDKGDVDFRVASIDTSHGEKIVIRILNKSTAVFSLEQLGFLPESQRVYRQLLESPYGMVMVSGPTGSGKTTSLYASLLTLDATAKNIVTIEDPVEYHFPGISQTQVNEQAGVTFAAGLRGLLRMDPDVMLVGEIRDKDTAVVAIQAALTGHLVLTTIHANDSASAIIRLIDLGVEPFLVTSAIIGSVAQRLVRKICSYCKTLVTVSPQEAAIYQMEMGEPRNQFYLGRGCNICTRSGYQSRVGVYEVLTITDNVRRAIVDGATSEQIRAQAVKDGLVTMRHDGMTKAKDGITTPAEVMRNVFTIS
ncbi:MAG: Flp pilus assembly complex ATPase component TadA [Chloroflexi bacterium]|nr:Flp pilus assembly complex ATPase component TadA [Chloroflexota bacterium]